MHPHACYSLNKADQCHEEMAVSKIREDILSRLVVSDQMLVLSSALAKGGFVDGSKTFEKPGYFPLGVVSVNVSGTGSGVCIPRSTNISSFDEGTVTIYGGVRNVGTTDATTCNLLVRILWLKL